MIDPRLAIALAILAVLIALCLPAQAHCFAIWRYPHAQRCETLPPVARIERRMAAPAPRVLEPSPGPSFDIPTLDADPAMTALRAQLWTFSPGPMSIGLH